MSDLERRLDMLEQRAELRRIREDATAWRWTVAATVISSLTAILAVLVTNAVLAYFFPLPS